LIFVRFIGRYILFLRKYVDEWMLNNIKYIIIYFVTLQAQKLALIFVKNSNLWLHKKAMLLNGRLLHGVLSETMFH